jgi:hypothetical protein
VAQVVVATSNTPATTTSIIPYDDTIPQNTEGAEFLTATITPTNSTSNLIIEFDAWGATSNLDGFVLALFRDSTVDAIQARILVIPTGNYSVHLILRAVVSASSTSSTTFKIRYGPSDGSTACMLRTGLVTSVFGGSDSATLTVTEVLP